MVCLQQNSSGLGGVGPNVVEQHVALSELHWHGYSSGLSSASGVVVLA
jgi:hypothetical protein